MQYGINAQDWKRGFSLFLGVGVGVDVGVLIDVQLCVDDNLPRLSWLVSDWCLSKLNANTEFGGHLDPHKNEKSQKKPDLVGIDPSLVKNHESWWKLNFVEPLFRKKLPVPKTDK